MDDARETEGEHNEAEIAPPAGKRWSTGERW